MECRVLKLVIQSAQGLKDVSHVTPMKPYALVSIRDNQNNLHSSSEEKTPEDAVGGSNPKWNSPVTLNLDITKAKESNLELVVKLMSLRTGHWFRDKEIGEVRVLITKLLEDFGGKAKADAVVAEKQMSASVMTTDKKPQGTLVFSYKFESGSTAVQKPATQKNSPTAQQNVQQNSQQPAVLGNQLKSVVASVSNNTGLKSVVASTGLKSAVASDATAAQPPPAAAADQRGTAYDPSGDNINGRIAGTASDAAAVEQHGAVDPSEVNNDKDEDEDYADEADEEEA